MVPHWRPIRLPTITLFILRYLLPWRRTGWAHASARLHMPAAGLRYVVVAFTHHVIFHTTVAQLCSLGLSLACLSTVMAAPHMPPASSTVPAE